MAGTQNMGQKRRGATTNEQYLSAVFSMLKKRDGIILSDKKTHFNDTELRLIGEVLDAKKNGKRVISTQLASKLGVTRSAISQIVNRLEESGVVKRVPDAVDRKIAYIEVTEDTMKTYKEDVKACGDFVGRVVRRFGEERFNQMQSMLDEFMGMVDEEKQREAATATQKKKMK